MEQNPKFLEEARATVMGEEYAGRVDNFIAKGLQEFEPEVLFHMYACPRTSALTSGHLSKVAMT